jgi:hypothetical protein
MGLAVGFFGASGKHAAARQFDLLDQTLDALVGFALYLGNLMLESLLQSEHRALLC